MSQLTLADRIVYATDKLNASREAIAEAERANKLKAEAALMYYNEEITRQCSKLIGEELWEFVDLDDFKPYDSHPVVLLDIPDAIPIYISFYCHSQSVGLNGAMKYTWGLNGSTPFSVPKIINTYWTSDESDERIPIEDFELEGSARECFSDIDFALALAVEAGEKWNKRRERCEAYNAALKAAKENVAEYEAERDASAARDLTSQERAEALAKLLGGEAWNSGGGCYIMTLTRADGKVVAISDEVIGLYPDVESVGDEAALISSIVLV